jgi:hypothetical protein
VSFLYRKQIAERAPATQNHFGILKRVVAGGCSMSM